MGYNPTVKRWMLGAKFSNCGLKKFHLILHLKFHLMGGLEAVAGQFMALKG